MFELLAELAAPYPKNSNNVLFVEREMMAKIEKSLSELNAHYEGVTGKFNNLKHDALLELGAKSVYYEGKTFHFIPLDNLERFSEMIYLSKRIDFYLNET